MYTLGAIVNTTFYTRFKRLKRLLMLNAYMGLSDNKRMYLTKWWQAAVKPYCEELRQQKTVSNQVMTGSSKTLLWGVEATKYCI